VVQDVGARGADRVAGALLGLAVGDALGAGYEFTTPGPDADIEVVGGGGPGWAPGEWTDDTAQAVAIAEVLATGRADLVAIGQRILDWRADGPKDIGIQTSAVLGAARSAADLPGAAAAHFARNPRGAAGNGSLMRTAPVALARLGDDEGIADLARRVSLLTHGDPLAAEACVLWCTAVDRAVREERLDGVRDGLALLPADRRADWSRWLDEAEARPPATFNPNGFVVPALQAAHAAIVQTPVPADDPARHLRDALVAAVRIGHDTDTVAAIAGQVLGARWGASAVPERWRRLLHGWPGLDADDLVRLALRVAGQG
jgi:ADP-ribosyl-[dinitrogen reductase] hydrolase